MLVLHTIYICAKRWILVLLAFYNAYIYTHLLNQFKGLVLGNPKKNLKSSHFVAGNIENRLWGGGRYAPRLASQAAHVERGQKHHRKCAVRESSTRTGLSGRQHKVKGGSHMFCLAVLTNCLAPSRVEGMAN